MIATTRAVASAIRGGRRALELAGDFALWLIPGYASRANCMYVYFLSWKDWRALRERRRHAAGR